MLIYIWKEHESVNPFEREFGNIPKFFVFITSFHRFILYQYMYMYKVLEGGFIFNNENLEIAQISINRDKLGPNYSMYRRFIQNNVVDL